MRRATIKKWCLRLGLISFTFFLAFCWVVGDQITRPVNRPVPLRSKLPIVETTVESETGSIIATWFADHPSATSTIVLVHPIRGDRRSMLSRAELLYAHGHSVVLVDLQAHGESPGERITLGHLERHDVRAAVEFAKRSSPDHRVIVLGRSLGGAAALLASPLPIDGLILESVYPTIQEATKNRLSRRIGILSHLIAPLLSAQLPIRLGINTNQLRPIDHLVEIGCPVLIMSGELDERTTDEETKRMFALARVPKTLVLFPRASHEDLLANDRRLYIKSVSSFLSRYQ